MQSEIRLYKPVIKKKTHTLNPPTIGIEDTFPCLQIALTNLITLSASFTSLEYLNLYWQIPCIPQCIVDVFGAYKTHPLCIMGYKKKTLFCDNFQFRKGKI